MCNRGGFTLIELLLVLALLSVSLALAAAPLNRALQRHTLIADTRSLLHLVRLSRQSAIDSGTRIVVCTVDAQSRCTQDWSQGIMVFSDLDRNSQINDGDRIIHHWNQGNRTKLHWRGFGPGYLRFRSSGNAVENGAFTLCPGDGDHRLAHQLVVNRVGRAYLSRDRDGDGVVEYGDGQEPQCD